MSKNPFIVSVIPPDAPFCNRIEELEQLTAYALNGTNVVLFSPRRFGKTSLVKRALRTLTTLRPVFKPARNGSFSIGIELASPNLHGIDLLDKTLEDLGVFTKRAGPEKIHIVFNEFQEITELKKSAKNLADITTASLLLTEIGP